MPPSPQQGPSRLRVDFSSDSEESVIPPSPQQGPRRPRLRVDFSKYFKRTTERKSKIDNRSEEKTESKDQRKRKSEETSESQAKKRQNNRTDTISATTRKTKKTQTVIIKKRKREIRHCVECGKPQQNIWRHMMTMHHRKLEENERKREQIISPRGYVVRKCPYKKCAAVVSRMRDHLSRTHGIQGNKLSIFVKKAEPVFVKQYTGKKGKSKKETESSKPNTKERISSDSEEEDEPLSRKIKKETESSTQNTTIIISSDSDEEDETLLKKIKNKPESSKPKTTVIISNYSEEDDEPLSQKKYAGKKRTIKHEPESSKSKKTEIAFNDREESTPKIPILIECTSEDDQQSRTEEQAQFSEEFYLTPTQKYQAVPVSTEEEDAENSNPNPNPKH